jgi:hypothetical protein
MASKKNTKLYGENYYSGVHYCLGDFRPIELSRTLTTIFQGHAPLRKTV